LKTGVYNGVFQRTTIGLSFESTRVKQNTLEKPLTTNRTKEKKKKLNKDLKQYKAMMKEK
jgi:hypothetical protein